jgi:hypothetical protein
VRICGSPGEEENRATGLGVGSYLLERSGLDEECPVLSRIGGTFISTTCSHKKLWLVEFCGYFFVAYFFKFLGKPL